MTSRKSVHGGSTAARVKLAALIALSSLLGSCASTEVVAPQDNRNVPAWAIPHLTIKHIV